MRPSRRNGHLYDARWYREKARYLKAHPKCVLCGCKADVIDHIQPHRGDISLFWDKRNWAPMCAHHHNSAKQAMEKHGHIGSVCDEDGNPMMASHPWRE